MYKEFQNFVFVCAKNSKMSNIASAKTPNSDMTNESFEMIHSRGLEIPIFLLLRNANKY